jgi:hypothetical protein
LIPLKLAGFNMRGPRPAPLPAGRKIACPSP